MASYNEIIEELRSRLGDSPEENEKLLRAEAEKFAKAGDSEGFRACEALILENIPEERRNEIIRLTHIDGVRLDKMYEQIVELMNKKEYAEAKKLAEKLYKKIIVEFKEGEKAKFVSLRNPFEENLYQIMFKPEKELVRAPFDFSEFITAYAFIMVETGSALDAIPILEKAVEYNPVDCGPKFELAEVYKLMKNRRQVELITKETLRVASSPLALARCYANMGYSLTDAGEYDDAAAFYTASVMFAPNPQIPLEMQHLADIKGSPIMRPSRDEIIEVFKKYGFGFGPNPEVIQIASHLAAYYLNEKDIPNAVKAMKLTYNLTLDEDVKKLILKYDPNASQYVSNEQEARNITQTINEHPEEQ